MLWRLGFILKGFGSLLDYMVRMGFGLVRMGFGLVKVELVVRGVPVWVGLTYWGRENDLIF